MSTELYDVATCEKTIIIDGKNILVTWWGGMLEDKEEVLMDFAIKEITNALKEGDHFGNLLYEDDRNPSIHGIWVNKI